MVQVLYNELFQLESFYLAHPPRRDARERLLSGAGLVYNEKLSSLTAERAEQLLFLKLKFMNKMKT